MRIKFVLLCIIMSIATNSFGAGYELLEQSGNGVGQAFAGSSTGFGDGSESFFNPAALTNLPSDTGSAHVHFVIPSAQFESEGSAILPAGIPLTGNNGGDGGEFAVVPNFYLTHQASDDVTLGLGVNSPFGLSTKYNDTWIGRYHAIESSLELVNINPAIGVKINDMFSFGASMQTYYADAKLTNAVDFGTIGAATLGLPLASRLGLLPQQADGLAEVTGDDWGVGYGLGALITPSKDFKIGVNFRSKVDLSLKGDGEFTVPTNALPLTSTGLFTNQSASSDVTLPESINLGASYAVNDAWTVLADATWINWSRFDELRVEFDGAQPDSVQDEMWDDTWRFSLGARYKVCDQWSLRLGIASDESPIPNSAYRTPRIPDNDRFWTAFGLTYQIDDSSDLSFDYAHIFVSDTSTDIVNSTGARLAGDWDLGVEVASLRYNFRF